jgi:hypothetical protein
MIDKLLRYGIIGQILGPEPDGTILDVGAGPMGLGACLPYKFVGVDPWYPLPPIPAQQAVMASGTHLPFRDNSFDYVLCMEVLEHIPPDLRAPMVAEMLRVARKTVMISHPFGALTRLSDYLLYGIYGSARIIGIKKPWWLVEHLQNPYPDHRKYLRGVGDGCAIRIRGQENIFMHLLSTLIGNLKVVTRGFDKFYVKHPEALKRFVRGFDFPPYHRKFIVIEKISANTPK